MVTKYKILHWNANGLLQNSNELKIFIETNKIDIALISETHLSNKSIFRMNNYYVYRADHPDNRSHGGSAILINKKIKHHESDKHQLRNLQANSVVIDDNLGQFAITAIYCPPNQKISASEFQQFFKALGKRFIPAGDYNAKYQSKRIV